MSWGNVKSLGSLPPSCVIPSDPRDWISKTTGIIRLLDGPGRSRNWLCMTFSIFIFRNICDKIPSLEPLNNQTWPTPEERFLYSSYLKFTIISLFKNTIYSTYRQSNTQGQGLSIITKTILIILKNLNWGIYWSINNTNFATDYYDILMFCMACNRQTTVQYTLYLELMRGLNND